MTPTRWKPVTSRPSSRAAADDGTRALVIYGLLGFSLFCGTLLAMPSSPPQGASWLPLLALAVATRVVRARLGTSLTVAALASPEGIDIDQHRDILVPAAATMIVVALGMLTAKLGG